MPGSFSASFLEAIAENGKIHNFNPARRIHLKPEGPSLVSVSSALQGALWACPV